MQESFLDSFQALSHLRGMWFSLFRPRTDPDASLVARIQALEASQARLEADMGSWEARAMKLSRELSRTLKSLAEIERRESLKASPDLDQLELMDEEPTMIQTALRIAHGR